MFRWSPYQLSICPWVFPKVPYQPTCLARPVRLHLFWSMRWKWKIYRCTTSRHGKTAPLCSAANKKDGCSSKCLITRSPCSGWCCQHRVLTLRNPELRKLIGRLSGQGLKLLWQPPQVHCPVVALLLSVNDLEPELPSLQDGIALFGFNISMQCPNELIFSSGVASKKLPQHRLIGRGQHHLSPRIPPKCLEMLHRAVLWSHPR